MYLVGKNIGYSWFACLVKKSQRMVLLYRWWVFQAMPILRLALSAIWMMVFYRLMIRGAFQDPIISRSIFSRLFFLHFSYSFLVLYDHYTHCWLTVEASIHGSIRWSARSCRSLLVCTVWIFWIKFDTAKRPGNLQNSGHCWFENWIWDLISTFHPADCQTWVTIDHDVLNAVIFYQ